MKLAGTRLAVRNGVFYFIHRADSRWERLGTDLAHAKARSAFYLGSSATPGTVAFWLDQFLIDCAGRVAASDLSERTLCDYSTNVVPLKAAFGALAPEAVTPHLVQTYLQAGKRARRSTRANREVACLSSCLSWLIRTGRTPQVQVNVCLGKSGIKRNPEPKRSRYVTDAEYHGVYIQAPAQVQLMMDLVYRTLQRPEIDVLAWTTANIVRSGPQHFLRNRQSKTGKTVDIALSPELDERIRFATGPSPGPHLPLIRTRDGQPYTYDGISSMLRRAQARAGVDAFGFRDLKGKGATDMWLGGVLIPEIQHLCGHESSQTTEIYIKQRWRALATPNMTRMGGAA